MAKSLGYGAVETATASHFTTPPTATRYQQNSPRYTNKLAGTKDRANQGRVSDCKRTLMSASTNCLIPFYKSSRFAVRGLLSVTFHII